MIRREEFAKFKAVWLSGDFTPRQRVVATVAGVLVFFGLPILTGVAGAHLLSERFTPWLGWPVGALFTYCFLAEISDALRERAEDAGEVAP